MLAVAISGCGASSGTTSAGPSLRPASASLRPVSVSEADRDRTVVLKVGQRLVLTLHSTYWTVTKPGASGPLRLRVVGTHPAAPGASPCVVGQGCGTVAATFVAVHRGKAVVRAHRSSCGEAMLCIGDAGTFAVSVRVR